MRARFGHRYRRQRRQAEEAFQAINITPFTDVLLVLLIIFLIAGSSLTRQALGVEKLSGPEGEDDGAQQQYRLRLSEGGELRRLSSQGVYRGVESADLDPSLPWELSAEPATRAQIVVATYDRLLKEGFRDLSLSAP